MEYLSKSRDTKRIKNYFEFRRLIVDIYPLVRSLIYSILDRYLHFYSR